MSSTGLNPCRPLAGNRDRDRRPCKGFSPASVTRPVASAQAASRHRRDADARLSLVGPALACRSKFSMAHMKTRQTKVCPTKSAKSARPPGLPTGGCAMISSSWGHGAGMLEALRVPRRSTPMMGIDRSTLSSRSILFLFVLLGTPMGARCDTLEDSARELARKIAAALPARESVSIELRNISSLHTGEIARIEQALRSELEMMVIYAPMNGSASIRVEAVLSENVKSFVWTAEIQQDGLRVPEVQVAVGFRREASPYRGMFFCG